jgi:hypothetical protein
MGRRLQRLLVVMAIATLAGCSPAAPTRMPFVPGPDRILFGETEIVLIDDEDLARLLEPLPEGYQMEFGVQPVAGQADAVAVYWMGGLCDIRTNLTLQTRASSVVLTIASVQREGNCPAAGVGRGALIRFDGPAPAMTLQPE